MSILPLFHVFPHGFRPLLWLLLGIKIFLQLMGRRQEGLEQNLSTIGGLWSKISPTNLFSIKANNYLSLKPSLWASNTSDLKNSGVYHYLHVKGKKMTYQYPVQLHSKCLKLSREDKAIIALFLKLQQPSAFTDRIITPKSFTQNTLY